MNLPYHHYHIVHKTIICIISWSSLSPPSLLLQLLSGLTLEAGTWNIAWFWNEDYLMLVLMLFVIINNFTSKLIVFPFFIILFHLDAFMWQFITTVHLLLLKLLSFAEMSAILISRISFVSFLFTADWIIPIILNLFSKQFVFKETSHNFLNE